MNEITMRPLQFAGKTETGKTKKLLNALLIGTTLLGGAESLKNDVFVRTAAAQTVQTADDNATKEAKKQLDEVVEAYWKRSLDDQKAADKLKTINFEALDQDYKGLHMLFDHYLQRELFVEKEGEALQKLGVRVDADKPEEMHFENPKDFPKPKPELLAQGGVGKQVYDSLLKIDNFVNLDSESLATLAKKKYDQLETDMNVLAKKLNPDAKDWKDVYKPLRAKHPKKDELLDVYRKEVDRAKAFLKEKDIISFPPERVQVIETPFYYRDAVPYAAYLPQGHGRGQFFVTTVVDTDPAKEEEQLQAHNYGFIYPVVVHEAFPGHHLQHAHTALVNLDPSNPDTKTKYRIFDLIPSNTFFSEGWGVYSEELMREQGYYAKATEHMKPEEQELFALRNILWRAARAWIDPQVNTGKMKYDDAVDFLVDNVLLERDRAEIEVNRYFQRPSNVASYMVGLLQMQQMRDQVKGKEGKNFQLKKYHDELFKEGTELPVPVISRMRFDQSLEFKPEPPPSEAK